MTYDTLKNQYGERLLKIVDVHLLKCKYTDDEWVGYGSGTLQTYVSDVYTGPITMSGTQATKFTEDFVWVRFGGSPELAKATVTSDTEVNIIARGEFGTVPVEHSIGTSVTIVHSGEADGSCYGLIGCSAKNNYVKGLERVFRFPSANLDLGDKYFHGFESEKPTTPTVKPSESMGSRGSTSISIKDGLDADSYVPYASHRTQLSTLWRKLEARSPYFEGRKLVVYDGFQKSPVDLNAMQRREYIIDDLQINKGKVSIKGVDPLILTEDKKAKAPLVTPISLEVAITDATTAFTYREAIDYYFGPLATQLYVRIDSEVILVEVTNTRELTVVTRAVKTERKDHGIAATIQYVLYYQKQNCVAIIEDLIENFTEVDPVYLDDYTDIKAATAGIQLTAFITKPEAVATLINEILRLSLLTMWFNPVRSKIEIKLSNDPSIEPVLISDDDNIGIDSLKYKRDPSDQITRSTIAYAPNDITKTSGDENFSVVYKAANVDIEFPQNKGEVNDQKTFYCRWLQDPQDIDEFAIATSMIDNEVSRNYRIPKEIEFDLDIKDVGVVTGGNVDLASVISVKTDEIVNPDGTPISENYQIINITNKEMATRRVKARLYQQLITGGDVDFTITSSQEDYVLADDPGFTPVADTHYSILIPAGVVIGSTTTTGYAFDTGTLPSGVSLTLYVQGQILGRGGDGGHGGNVLAPNPADATGLYVGSGFIGYDGSHAINATCQMDIYAGSGLIAGGGGGGAGWYSIIDTRFGIYINAGNGGCGGQGYVGGTGGARGTAEIDASSYYDEGQDGVNGSLAGPGSLAGQSGGRFGESGDSATNPNGAVISGGSTGIAIKKNGNTVTIKSGAIGLFGNIRGTIED